MEINYDAQASYSITVAMLGNDIILPGYHLICCYSYNHSAFTSILNLLEVYVNTL